MKFETIKSIMIIILASIIIFSAITMAYSWDMKETYNEGYEDGIVDFAKDQTENGILYYSYMQGNDTYVEYISIEDVCGSGSR